MLDSVAMAQEQKQRGQLEVTHGRQLLKDLVQSLTIWFIQSAIPQGNGVIGGWFGHVADRADDNDG